MRLRLLLSFFLIVLVSVIGVVVLARRGAVNEVRAFMFHGGMTGTDELVDLLEDFYRSHGSWQGVESLFHMPGHGRGMGQGGMGRGMGGMMMNQRLRLADAHGNLLIDTAADSIAESPIARLNDSELQNAFQLQVNGGTVGYLLADSGMSFSLNDERFLVGRVTRAGLVAGVIAAAFSSLLALLLAYSLMRPVRELTRAARKLGEGDLTQRVQIRGKDELAMLGSAFNRMADTLQKSHESRKAMTADIAHELRNPLAVQRADLEALQDGIYPLNAENLHPILEQNLLLTHLVEDLRTLALADAGQLELERHPVDAIGLITRIVEGFKSQASARQINLALEIDGSVDPSLNASLDPMRVEQILNNIISNALRFTPDGGEILIKLKLDRNGLNLSFRDSGPGIPPESLAHVFERFYRADQSRTRAEGGTGLGLAIARHLAEAHGGTLTAGNHPEGGALFTLTLPLS